MGDFFVREFILLLGKIFLISCLQTLIEVFMNIQEKSYQSKILNIACFCGTLYILLEYVSQNIIKELFSFLRLNF